MKTFSTLKIVTTAMLSAIAVILASTFHHLAGQTIATLFSPMHFPVFLAGIMCGQWLGLICGVITPLVSFASSGRPPFPNGLIPMVFELALYGFLSGVLRSVFLKNGKTSKVYSTLALVISMIAGRALNALVGAAIISVSAHTPFFVALWTRFLENFSSTWAGIIVQLILIPLVMFALKRSGILIKYIPIEDLSSKPSESDEGKRITDK